MKSYLDASHKTAKSDLAEFRKIGGKNGWNADSALMLRKYGKLENGTLAAKPNAILKDLMLDNQFVHLGEPHHSEPVKAFLHANLQAMVDAGIKYYFCEVIPQQPAADLKNLKIQHQEGERVYFLGLGKQAEFHQSLEANGIQLCPIERPGHSTETLPLKYRGNVHFHITRANDNAGWAKRIARQMSETPSAKAIIHVGAWHLSTAPMATAQTKDLLTCGSGPLAMQSLIGGPVMIFSKNPKMGKIKMSVDSAVLNEDGKGVTVRME